MQGTNKYLNTERSVWLFLLLWTTLNILQACTLGLHADEAYYWLFSRFLDWGYFDHPPMVALFIRAGDSIIHNEFGLRLVTILSSTVSLYLLWCIVKKYNANALWFILVAGGMFTLHIYGFITTPDAPLLLFTVLFFYVYRQYLEKDTWWRAVLLGVIVAGLLYSKYHAILLIGFTILSNVKLLKQWTFWLVAATAVILYLPHIVWQVQHDYQSVGYHLTDRAERNYRLDFSFNYILSQVAMAGPLIGWILFYKGFTVRAGDAFTRGLKLNFIGTILFFLVTSVRGEVQPQWTIVAFAALIILVLINIGQKGNPPAWFMRLAVANICLIVVVRLLLIIQPPFVKNIQAVKIFFGQKEWAHTIKQKAGDRWLVMNDGFQLPAKYCFYNNTLKCFSYDSRYYRLTQFEIWPMEDSVQGKSVYYIGLKPEPGITDPIPTTKGLWYGGLINDVRTYQRIKIEPPALTVISAPSKKSTFALTITNPYTHAVNFSNTGQTNAVFLEASFFNNDDEISVQQAGADFNNIHLQPGGTSKYNFTFTAPAKKGRYDMMFSLRTQPFNGSKNSRVISFTVE